MASDISLSKSVTKSHGDLELLVSRCSIEKHTFVTSWGVFILTPEDILLMFHLPLFADEDAMSIVLYGVEEKRL